jgi:signal transduction histidine kinase
MTAILLFLALTNLILLSCLFMIVIDLNRIISDLNYINQHQTNALVTANTNLPIIRQLIKQINANLTKLQVTEQTINQQEKKIHQLLMNLIHDIKTPLAVAMGYSQLLARQTDNPDQTTIKRITSNLKAVNYYLHHLTDFNLIQAQAEKLKIQPTNLSQLLEGELLNFYDELTTKKITVQLEIDENIQLATDQALMKRIIQNLISNWLKYATQTATVQLKEADDSHVALTFSNQTSASITNIEQLTNRFFTTDTAHTYQNTGLGLSIVQSLTTAIGGKMKLTAGDHTFQVSLLLRRTMPATRTL